MYIGQQFIPKGTEGDPYESCDEFERAYITALLWTEEERMREEEPDMGGGSFQDFHADTLASIKEDCAKFRESDAYKAAIAAGWWTEPGAGHDFWLTRNGHGVGFWDRYSESQNKAAHDLGDVLSEVARKFGESFMYFGDDKKIHN